MSFKHTTEITPHADGVHCGECVYRTGLCHCSMFLLRGKWWTPCDVSRGDSDNGLPLRCEACLDAELAHSTDSVPSKAPTINKCKRCGRDAVCEVKLTPTGMAMFRFSCCSGRGCVVPDWEITEAYALEEWNKANAPVSEQPDVLCVDRCSCANYRAKGEGVNRDLHDRCARCGADPVMVSPVSGVYAGLHAVRCLNDDCVASWRTGWHHSHSAALSAWMEENYALRVL